MQPVQTDKAPIPAGHYSQGMIHGDMVFVSGQLPIDPHSKSGETKSAEEQTEQVLANVKAVLEASGSALDHTLQMTIYISDLSLWGKVNEVYARIMGAHKPARAIVPTRELHHGYVIEVQAIGVIKRA